MGFHLVFPQTRSAELKENGCVDSSSLGEKGLSDMTQNQDFHFLCSKIRNVPIIIFHILKVAILTNV